MNLRVLFLVHPWTRPLIVGLYWLAYYLFLLALVTAGCVLATLIVGGLIQ